MAKYYQRPPHSQISDFLYTWTPQCQSIPSTLASFSKVFLMPCTCSMSNQTLILPLLSPFPADRENTIQREQKVVRFQYQKKSLIPIRIAITEMSIQLYMREHSLYAELTEKGGKNSVYLLLPTFTWDYLNNRFQRYINQWKKGGYSQGQLKTLLNTVKLIIVDLKFLLQSMQVLVLFQGEVDGILYSFNGQKDIRNFLVRLRVKARLTRFFCEKSAWSQSREKKKLLASMVS